MLKPEDFKVGDRWLDKDGDEHEVIAILPGRPDGEIVTAWGASEVGAWHADDSFFVRKRGLKHVVYLNVYANSMAFPAYLTAADADAGAYPHKRIARVRVEFEEGQYDE